MSKILLTGITGLVGSAFTVALLKERKDHEIVCLARGGINRTAMDRVVPIIHEQCAFDGCPEVAEEVLSRVTVVEGDVTTMDIDALVADPALQGVDVMFHCAADVNLGKDPTGKTFNINYGGTVNMLELARRLQVKAFHYVSTAYIAGKINGRAMEDNPVDNGFNNPYEESKFKAEQLVRNSGFPFTIYRPSIITGRLCDGRIRRPLAFYRILEFMGKLKKHHCAKEGLDPLDFTYLPLHFDTKVSEAIYFVPIDYVQKSITALFQEPVENRAYHITGDSPVTTVDIEGSICDFLRIKGVRVELGSAENNTDERLMSRFLGDLLPYFASNIAFDQTNVRGALGDEALAWTMGRKGLETMIRSFYADFFPEVEWVQELVKASEARHNA